MGNKMGDKKRREWYISHGICPACGQRKAEGGRQLCLLCWDLNNSRRREARKRNPETEEHRKARYAQINELRNNRRAAGLCIKCGRPAAPGKVSCHECLKKDRDRQAEIRRKNDIITFDMRGNGTYCFMCCKPKCNGEKLCEECKQKVIANVSKGRTYQNPKNHVWKKYESARLAEVKYKRGWNDDKS